MVPRLEKISVKLLPSRLNLAYASVIELVGGSRMKKVEIREALIGITMRNTINGVMDRALAEEVVDGLIADDDSPFYAGIKSRTGDDDEVRETMRRAVAIYRRSA
jgi:hypothetical protein